MRSPIGACIHRFSSKILALTFVWPVLVLAENDNSRPKDGENPMPQEELTTATRLYEGGRGDYRRFPRAFSIFDALARSGDQRARAYRGHMHWNGLGTERNTEKGLKDIRMAAENRDQVAMVSWAWLLATGFASPNGVPDLRAAEEFAQQAAAMGEPLGFSQLSALKAWRGSEHDYAEATALRERAFAAARKAATSGVWRTRFCLAEFQIAGPGVSPDYTEASQTYAALEADGSVFAKAGLGICEFTLAKRGDIRRAKAGARILAEAADAGCLTAMRILAFHYMTGSHPEGKNIAKALALLRVASEHGEPTAIALLADMYIPQAGVSEQGWNSAVGGANIEIAIKLYQRAYSYGHGEAARVIADLYADGRHPEGSNRQQALSWYQKGALLGSFSAMIRAGMLNDPSVGSMDRTRLEEDGEQAKIWYTRASLGGSADGMHALGLYYQKGIGTPKNVVRSAEWMERSYKAGNKTAAAYELARTLLGKFDSGSYEAKARDPERAMALLEESCAAGYTLSMWAIGDAYANGTHPEGKNHTKAVEWFTKAADEKQGIAMAELGLYYAPFPTAFCKDRNVAVGGSDAKRASDWLEKGALAGSSYAMAQLGFMYSDGLHPEGPSLTKALEWFRRAGDAGDADGMAQFANYYAPFPGDFWTTRNKIVDGPDAAKAAELYEKAAALGSAFAMVKMGYFFRDGLHPEGVDLRKALDWFRKASEAGDADAMSQVANYYAPFQDDFWTTRNKIVGGPDAAKAAELYEKAAALGSAFGKAKMGFLHLSDLLTDGDSQSKAFQWLASAATAGDEEAEVALALSYYLPLEVDGQPERNRIAGGANPARAEELFESAGSKGCYAAYKALAEGYLAGWFPGGVDLNKAYESVVMAAEAGDVQSMLFLFTFTYPNDLTGIEGSDLERLAPVKKRDIPLAVRMAKMAWEEGEPTGAYFLAMLYLSGDHPEGRDNKKGIQLLSEAAAGDEKEVIPVLAQLASSGEADAMLALGVAYFEGHAVEQNRTVARAWFHKAKEAGVSVPAKYFKTSAQ